MAVQLPRGEIEQLVALNACMNVLDEVKLFPPAAIELTSMLTEVHPDGEVKV